MISDVLPRINVLIVTYNHADFVQKAIDSVLFQDIDEPFEIVVADDGSSDETMSIVRKAASNNPETRFRFLDCSTNRGITRNYQRAFAACTGDYIAVLEGDDYWVRTTKLRVQRDFLDSHRECDLCSTNYYVYDEHRSQFTPRAAAGTGHVMIGARDLIADNLIGNFSTCMYRLSALREIPTALYEMRSYDWVVNICIGRKGLIGFITEPMSVYRIHNRGAWSLLSHVEKLRTQLELIPAYDELTDHVYHEDFAVLSERLVKVIAESQSQPNLAEDVLLEIHGMRTALTRSRGLDFVPPIFLAICKQIVPPVFRRRLIKMVFKS